MALGVPEFRRALIRIGDALDGDIGNLVAAVGRLDVPAAMRLVTDAYPELASPYLARAADLTATWPVRPLILQDADDKRAAFAAADVALAASGTVSLELAAAGCPMVIAYDMHPLTMALMRAMARIDTVTLVNLVSDTRVVPEFLGRDCRAERIAPALEAVLANPAAQTAAMALTMQRLGQGGEAPGLRAARSVLAHLAPGGLS